MLVFRRTAVKPFSLFLFKSKDLFLTFLKMLELQSALFRSPYLWKFLISFIHIVFPSAFIARFIPRSLSLKKITYSTNHILICKVSFFHEKSVSNGPKYVSFTLHSHCLPFFVRYRSCSNVKLYPTFWKTLKYLLLHVFLLLKALFYRLFWLVCTQCSRFTADFIEPDQIKIVQYCSYLYSYE